MQHMELKQYFFALPMPERILFAESVGTSVGHLTNASYKYKKLDAKTCVAVEQASKHEVTRQELRPEDYWLIWPDLQEKAAQGA